ncbi:hypothetical protein [Spirillospora sp. NPDC029432]|uniref:hypothetical protein n=1 Tax=Spirillospora sp. NPDC029432 TaxID=3154599 RepID=UPI003452FEE4
MTGGGQGGKNDKSGKNKNSGGQKKQQGTTPAQRTQQQNKSNNAMGCGCVVAVILVVFVLPVLWSLYDEGVFDGNDRAMETAPVFGPRDAGRLVERLSHASKAQGVCYGWVVDSGRYRQIPKVTPSYSGTFRPEAVQPSTQPSAQPSMQPSTRPSARPSVRPTERTTATARPTAPRQGATPAPRRTRTSPAPTPTPSGTMSEYERAEMERSLEQLEEAGVEYGSNLGVGVDPRQVPDRCPKWVVLEADYSYSSQYQEWTSGTTSIESNIGDLDETSMYQFEEMLGQDYGSGDDTDDIDGEQGIARLADQIGAVPMLVAQEGLAPPVPAQAERVAPPPGDRISESKFTARNVFTGVGIALIALGVVWVTVAAVRNRRSTSS